MTLPLAAAAERLRREPGRPRKNAGEKTDEEIKAERAERRLARQAAQLLNLTPRLLDLDGAARYLSCSTWTIRGLIDSKVLQRVTIPTGTESGRDIRRVLLDRLQLDELVLRWQEVGR